MSIAVEIGTAYFNAWSTKNVDKAVEYTTEDVEIIGPNGTYTGHEGVHQFLDFFVSLITSVDDFTIHGDDGTATVWYDTHLTPVPSLPAGELLTIRDGKIAQIKITFDQTPLAQAFGGEAPDHK